VNSGTDTALANILKVWTLNNKVTSPTIPLTTQLPSQYMIEEYKCIEKYSCNRGITVLIIRDEDSLQRRYFPDRHDVLHRIQSHEKSGKVTVEQ